VDRSRDRGDAEQGACSLPAEDHHKEADEHTKLRLARNLLAKIIKADCSASNSVHPLRWPGSWNRKPGRPPVMAKIIEINEDAEIDLDDALALLKEVAKEMGIDHGGERKTTPPPNPEDYEDIGAKANAALQVIYNDLDYDDWINIGQEIWSAFNGSEEGRRQWHNFSAQRFDKYHERPPRGEVAQLWSRSSQLCHAFLAGQSERSELVRSIQEATARSDKLQRIHPRQTAINAGYDKRMS